MTLGATLVLFWCVLVAGFLLGWIARGLFWRKSDED